MRSEGEFDVRLLAALVGGLVVMYVAGGLPVFWASVAAGHPGVPGLVDAGCMWATMFGVTSPVPSGPSAGFAWRVDLLAASVAAVATLVVALRVDRWRGRRHLGRPSWDPRSHVEPRSLARPRDLLHLQGRVRGWRRWPLAATRVLVWDRRRPQPAGGDSWALGEIRRGVPLRSGPERHLMVVAPTRAGKTSRVLVPALREHCGPAVVLLNKVDALVETVEERWAEGPVWVYAPMTDPATLPVPLCAWSPLPGCVDWQQALLMSRWLHDSDPEASRSSEDSGGARYYNRSATSTVLPALLHAAALAGRSMTTVHEWLRAGVNGLDEPRAVLQAGGATAAAEMLGDAQALDDRQRGLLLTSAAQMVDAYRFPSVQAVDRPGFDPQDLLRAGGTLYLVAPEAAQDLVAPLFGAALSSVLRVWEAHAARTGGRPDGPILCVFADEAAHLAPLRSLPTYLAVSAGWGVRWMLVYQSIAQLRQRYGDEADDVLGNTLARLFMGPVHDATTARYLVELLDRETAETRSWTSRGAVIAGEVSSTRQQTREAVVSAQALMRLREGEALLIHGNDIPAVVRLPAPWQQRGEWLWW